MEVLPPPLYTLLLLCKYKNSLRKPLSADVCTVQCDMSIVVRENLNDRERKSNSQGGGITLPPLQMYYHENVSGYIRTYPLNESL